MEAIIALTVCLALHLDGLGERCALRRAVPASQVLTCAWVRALILFQVEIPNR
jgi:hypothetical protein